MDLLDLMDLWRRGEQPPNSQLAEVLVQLRLRRGREGTDLAFEARGRHGRHHVDVTGELLGISVCVGDVLGCNSIQYTFKINGRV